METRQHLAGEFEANRGHLEAVAHRMLGSLPEAEDAVQEAWVRLQRSDAGGIENLRGWLTTTVSRVALDMLRARRTRREEPLEETRLPDPVVAPAGPRDPEHEAVLADSVGLALLVVLDTLTPAERLAFVLHDTFSVPFTEIAAIVGRSPEATRQLASRARRRVRGSASDPGADPKRQREVVDAFLAAARDGRFDDLVALLDPDVVLRVQDGAGDVPRILRGAAHVAGEASGFASLTALAQPALVDGTAGFVVVRDRRAISVAALRVVAGRIVAMDAFTDPDRLAQLDLSAFGAAGRPPTETKERRG